MSISQRDAFWDKIYDLGRADPNVVIISVDMGAPALDRIRRDLPGQFINLGIAEQNAIVVAAGLAMSGKKVYTYAIASFMIFRCLEQIRVQNAMMNLPVCIVGVGAGFSYEDSGPTHHLLEDLSIMRSLPHIKTFSCTDSNMAVSLAEHSYETNSPTYMRLERFTYPNIYEPGQKFTEGVSVLREGKDGTIVATGAMVHGAIELIDTLKERGVELGLVNLYHFPVHEANLIEALSQTPKVVTLEEHFLPGGLGSAVCEVLADHGVSVPIKRIGCPIDKGYCYQYGGREILRGYYGIDKASIERKVVEFIGAASPAMSTA